jgi:hypothetical protein
MGCFDATLPATVQETGWYEWIPNKKECLGGGQLYVTGMV